MNPNDIVAGQNAWIDNVDLGNGKKGFSRTVTYADGRKVLELYEYGVEGGPIAEKDAGKDPKIAADYLEYVKKNTPVRTDVKYNPAAGQPGHDPSLPVGTAIKTATPEGGDTRVVGTEAPSPKEATDKPKVITSKHDDKTGVTSVLVENPDGTRKWDTITGGPKEGTAGKIVSLENGRHIERDTQGNLLLDQPMSPAERDLVDGNKSYSQLKQDETTGQWYGVTKDGRFEPIQGGPGLKRPAATVRDVQGESGAYDVIREDPNAPGGVSITRARAEGVGKTTSAFNPEDLKLEAGKITQEGQRVLAQIKARMTEDPNYTWKDGERDWNIFESLKGTRLAEIKDILGAQAGIYRDESANYREQLQDQSSRRSFASNTMGQALRTVESVNSTLKPGSDAGGRGLLALLELGFQYANKLGGTQQIAPPTMGAGLQEAKGITINIGGGGAAPAITAGAPTGASPIGDPAVDAAAAYSDFAPAPGMTFDGGQLRAPGYQAALDASGADYMQNVRGADSVAQAAALETAAQLTEDPFFGDEVVSAYRSKYRV